MKKTHYKLTLFLIGFTIISCNKEDTVDEINYSYLSESIKPFKFMAGTYWIFQNDSTEILDSIVVISTENDFYWSPPSIQGQAGGKSEYFQMNLKSFLTLDIYNDYLTNYYIKRNGGGDYGENGQPIYLANRDIGTEFNGMTIIAKYESLTINSNTFENIVETKITDSLQYQPMFDNNTYLYFSDSIGLIKKVTDLGNGNYDSWSIKKWNLKK